MDDLKLTYMFDGPFANDPTVEMTKVNGASRIFTITNPNEDSKLYYTTSPADEAPEKGSDAYSVTDESPYEVTFSESGKYYVYVGLNDEVTTSEIVTIDVDATEVELPLPVLTLVGVREGWEKTYRVDIDNSSVPLKPAIKLSASYPTIYGDVNDQEIENGATFTTTYQGSITITATAEGYTSSEIELENDKEYAITKTINFAGMTSNDFNENWTENQTNESRWGFSEASPGTFFSLNDGADRTTAITGLSLWESTGDEAPRILIGKGLWFGVTTKNYAHLGFTDVKEGQYASITYLNNYGKATNNAVVATANGYDLYRFSDAIKTIEILEPSDEPVTALYTIESVDEDGNVIKTEKVQSKANKNDTRNFSVYQKFGEEGYEQWYKYTDANFIKTFKAVDGQVYQVQYEAAPKVVGFVEAENCKGNNSPTLSDQDKKYSGGYAAGLASENKKDRGTIIATLPAGAYEFHALLTEEVKHAVCLRNANIDYADDPIVSLSGAEGMQSSIFVLKEETQLRVTGPTMSEKTNLTEKFDYCYITNGVDYFDIADIAENNAKSTEENPNDGILTNSLLGVEGTTLEVTNDKENAGAIWVDTWMEDEEEKQFVDLRIQEDGSFTLATSSSSLALNKIVFTGAALDMSTAYGKFEEPAASRAHKAAPKMVTKTWTGNNDKVKFWADKTVRISTITVYLEPTDGNTENYEEKPRPEKPADKPALEVVANIAAFKALADSTEAKLTLTDAVVTFVNGKNIYLEDATGAIVLYDMGLELTEGQKLNGLLAGKTVNYFALPEMVKTDSTKTDTFTAEAGEVKATTMALADICKVENLARLITISNVTIDVVDNNIFATSGDEKLQVYNKFKIDGLDLQKGNVYTSITGILVPWQNKETLEITYELAPRTLADLVLDADATGISELAGEKAAREVYNLNGQRVNATKKGLYIINGKKVMVK